VSPSQLHEAEDMSVMCASWGDKDHHVHIMKPKHTLAHEMHICHNTLVNLSMEHFQPAQNKEYKRYQNTPQSSQKLCFGERKKTQSDQKIPSNGTEIPSAPSPPPHL